MNELKTIIENNKLYKHYYNHYFKSSCKQSYSKICQVCNQSKLKVYMNIEEVNPDFRTV